MTDEYSGHITIVPTRLPCGRRLAMGALVRSMDWSKTPIGDVETWSPALRMMVVVLPIRSNIARQLAGFLVLGLSSRLNFDDRYLHFCELVTSQIATPSRPPANWWLS